MDLQTFQVYMQGKKKIYICKVTHRVKQRFSKCLFMPPPTHNSRIFSKDKNVHMSLINAYINLNIVYIFFEMLIVTCVTYVHAYIFQKAKLIYGSHPSPFQCHFNTFHSIKKIKYISYVPSQEVKIDHAKIAIDTL